MFVNVLNKCTTTCQKKNLQSCFEKYSRF